MTRCYVNETEIELPQGLSSLSEVLKHLETVCLSPKSAIRQIKLDSRPLLTDDTEAIQEVPEASGPGLGAAKLEIMTGTLKDTAHGCIVEILTELNRIRDITDSLIMSYNANAVLAFCQHLNHLREGFCWLNLLLDKLAGDFQIDFKGLYIRGTAAAELRRRFSEVLQQFTHLAQKRDFRQLSELMEGEMSSMISAWIEMLDLVAQKIGRWH